MRTKRLVRCCRTYTRALISSYRVEPGQRGIDVSVPEKHIARLGFAHAEIKPLSASGEKKLRQQVGKWGYDPSTVSAITYDANGNVYFGFR